MSMTIDEMKLAVCEKLPELISVIRYQPYGGVVPKYSFRWKDDADHAHFGETINWPTEGLQVCHEAEKLLDKTALDLYNGTLRLIVFGPQGESPKDYSYPSQACIWNATYEQRLEALCRVWFPERF